MPLDPQVQALLDAAAKANLPPMWQLTPDQARAQYLLRVRRLEPKDEPIYRVEDRAVPGTDHQIPIRIYRPREANPGELLPVLVWYHGGGFVIGSLDTHDSACRRLATLGDCMVVSVDYRLAPEWKFPAGVDDSFAALKWISAHATEIGADPARIAVGGDSAGGNLATVCALLARNAGAPKVAFQLLFYPCIAPEPETPSHYKFADGYILTRQTITWFYKLYLKSPKDTQDFRFGPLITDDLSQLPPAFILVAGYDPLRDEGVQYATRLVEAGNAVTLVNMPGMVHGFLLMSGALDGAVQALEQSAAALRSAFTPREKP